MTTEDEDDVLPDDVDLDAELAAYEGSPRSPLARLTAEARDEKRGFLPPESDFSLMEQKLVLRLDTERAILKRSRRTQLGAGLVMSFALAAGVLFLLGRPAPEALPGNLAPPAIAFTSKGGPKGGTLRTDSNDPAGFVVGDTVEVADAAIVFERAAEAPGQPRRAIWAVDPTGESTGARLKVSKADATLVLSLERGAVEADVTPVRNGEAFAIDVTGAAGTTRIAVHGTHLRVSKKGDVITVDLTEGVIALGAPRDGRTEGREILAPAHVELVAGTDPAKAQVAQDHVRTAWTLDAIAEGRSPSSPFPSHVPSAQSTGAGAPTAVPKHPPTLAPSVAPAPSAAPIVALSEGAARTAIQVDMKRCAAQASGKTGGVAISVESTLSVDVRADGTVSGTRFDPPLSPAIQQCAAQAVLARHIEGPRSFTVPVKFDY
jgi:hypothetical protein